MTGCPAGDRGRCLDLGLPTAHCTDDGVGLVYHGEELVEAVAENDYGCAYVVTRDDAGAVHEERIEPRRLR